MTELTTATGGAMLSREEMDAARERLPIVYVDVVPVRVDELTRALQVTPAAVVVATHDRRMRADLPDWPVLELV